MCVVTILVSRSCLLAFFLYVSFVYFALCPTHTAVTLSHSGCFSSIGRTTLGKCLIGGDIDSQSSHSLYPKRPPVTGSHSLHSVSGKATLRANECVKQTSFRCRAEEEGEREKERKRGKAI